MRGLLRTFNNWLRIKADYHTLNSPEVPNETPTKNEPVAEEAPQLENTNEETQVPISDTKEEEPPTVVDISPSSEVPAPPEEMIDEEPSGEVLAEPEKLEEPVHESIAVLDEAPREVEEPDLESTLILGEVATEVEESVQKSASIPDETPQDIEEPISEPLPISHITEMEASEAPEDVEESNIPFAEIAAGAGAIGVIGMIAANLDSEKIADKDIVDEPKELDDIAEKEAPLDDPPSPKSDKRSSKHRSSRHSTHSSRHSSSKEKDSPTEESHRHHSHRKRRDSENSLKALFTPTSPKKPDRHDSGYSQGSGGSQNRHRTPEEQAAHEKRKAEYRAAKAKLAESESAVVDGHADVPLTRPESSRRMSSRRHSTSHGSKEDHKRPDFLDTKKGESVVKSPFIAKKGEPHIKEEVKEVKKPIMERPRYSIDGERPSATAVKELGRVHSHRERGARHSRERGSKEDRQRKERDDKDDRQRRERDDKERYRVEKDREARKVRKEAEKQLVLAREEVAEEAKQRRDKDDEERRTRREERRKRREDEERAADDGKGKERERERTYISSKNPRSDGSKDGEKSDRHRERRREMKIPKEEKSPLKSLWSSAKRVFG